MTKETKIGLLVGLAFIIVIGILLQDHFSGLQEPKPAPLGQVGQNVRSGAAIPASNRATHTIIAGESVLRHPVPTTRDLTQQAIAREIAAGERSRSGTEPRVTIGPGGESAVRPGEAVVRLEERRGAGSALERTARAAGEEIVAVDQRRTAESARRESATATPRQHKAEAGDTVSKMAARFLGANNRANRDAIIRANPSLQQNPNAIVVGKTYVIPASANAAPAGGAAPSSEPRTPAPATVIRGPDFSPPPAPAAPVAPASGDGLYTTKAGDTLWRIAVEQCGTASARDQILQLNRGVITDPNRVPVNVKLKLPPRAVASR